MAAFRSGGNIKGDRNGALAYTIIPPMQIISGRSFRRSGERITIRYTACQVAPEPALPSGVMDSCLIGTPSGVPMAAMPFRFATIGRATARSILPPRSFRASRPATARRSAPRIRLTRSSRCFRQPPTPSASPKTLRTCFRMSRFPLRARSLRQRWKSGVKSALSKPSPACPARNS